jgi:hypothetical protein
MLTARLCVCSPTSSSPFVGRRIADRRGLELKVYGPGALRRSYSFQDALSLVEYQVQFEKQLISNGYDVLTHSERRSGYDRRRQPRIAEDRRKQ